MMNASTSTQSDLKILKTRALNLKEGLKEISTGEILPSRLNRIAEAIIRQLDLEERIMEKIGKPLTSFHMDEHKKLRKDITLLEFSWKAKRVSDEIYIKALNYKFEFHQHYFDEAQLAQIYKRSIKSEVNT